jgi:uncharacterized membrane protein
VQRWNKDTLSTERRQRLEEIGFVWDPYTQQWEDSFAALKRFKEREGHCLLHQDHKENGIKLGQWIGSQRIKKDTLTPERIKRLGEIGFVWDVLTQQWEDSFAALKRFEKREGHCLVRKGHEESGIKLAIWVVRQRGNKDTLSTERRQRLEEIGFVWDPYTQKWEEGFTALLVFKQREGHCNASRGYKEGDYNLGSWINAQRRKKDSLSRERIQRLEELGIAWDPYTQQWEDNFAALSRFKQREGHCLVHQHHKENGIKLGSWVSNQRSIKDTLTPERIQRLEETGFVWDSYAQLWEDSFAALSRFKEREGHCLVEQSHKESGIKLGAWVKSQRTKKVAKKVALTPERRQRLDEIGFVWNARLPKTSGT